MFVLQKLLVLIAPDIFSVWACRYPIPHHVQTKMLPTKSPLRDGSGLGMARDVLRVIITMLSHGRRGQVDSLTGGFLFRLSLDLSSPFLAQPLIGAFHCLSACGYRKYHGASCGGP